MNAAIWSCAFRHLSLPPPPGDAGTPRRELPLPRPPARPPPRTTPLGGAPAWAVPEFFGSPGGFYLRRASGTAFVRCIHASSWGPSPSGTAEPAVDDSDR